VGLTAGNSRLRVVAGQRGARGPFEGNSILKHIRFGCLSGRCPRPGRREADGLVDPAWPQLVEQGLLVLDGQCRPRRWSVPGVDGSASLPVAETPM